MEENEIPGFLEISAELIMLILENGALTNYQTSNCHLQWCDVLYKRTTMEKASGIFSVVVFLMLLLTVVLGLVIF